MKIGIDARFLTHPQRGGFKTYTENLIHSIAQIDTDNQYILYVDRDSNSTNLPNQSNFDIRIVSGHLPLIGMPVREQMSLPRQARRDRVDIIHFLCNTASFYAPGKIVITLHDTIQVHNANPFKISGNISRYKNWFIIQYSKQAILQTIGRADFIITVSAYEKSVISAELNLPTNRINVTHLAPDPLFRRLSEHEIGAHREDIAKRLNIRDKYILGVGYETRKNIPLLIQAFSMLANDYRNLALVVVSANEQYRANFIQLVENLGLRDRVIILGSLSSDELAILYNLAEVFVFPSERESFGLPPLEAIACGTPTIAMNSSSLPEILNGGALFLETRAPEAWAKAITRVLSEGQLRSELIATGLQRASEFSWQKCARETIQVYQQVYQESR